VQVRPELSILSPEQIEAIHQDSLEVLSKTGVRVDSPRARELFKHSQGCKLVGETLTIQPELVEWAISSAPFKVDLFDRTGAPAFGLGQGQSGTIYGIGVTNSWYQNPQNDSLIPFERKHIATSTSLGNTLEQFDLISTPGIIQDTQIPHAEVLACLEMLPNTSKPLCLLFSDKEQFAQSLDMMEALVGDLASKPFIIPYFNPITPLVLNEDTTDKMFTCIQRGLPMIFSSYGMSGASTPISAEGTLVLLNAELLAGLVFAQLVQEGTPVVLGSLPSVFEMQNMFSAYTAQTMLVNLACAEMMAHYELPHAGTSGSGTGWGADLLASGTLWMNHLTSSMGKVGLAPFVGGNFDSQAFSPTTVVYANEVIRQVRQFVAGFDLGHQPAILDDIAAAGPGGSFLTSRATLAQYRELHEQHSQIWPGYTISQWLTEGSPSGLQILRQQTQSLLDNPRVPEDHDDLLARGEDWFRTTFL